MMRNLLLSKKIAVFLIVLVGLLVGAGNVWGATRTASVSGNWNNTATWGGQSVPVAADVVIINSGVTVTVTANAACTSITFTGTSGSLAVNSGIVLTVSGAIIRNSLTTGSTSSALSGAGTLNCESITIGSGGGSSSTTNRTTTITSTIANLNVSNQITLNSSYATRRNNSTLTHTSGTITTDGITTITPANTTSIYSMGNTSPRLNLTGSVPFTIGTGGGASTITLTGTGATVDYQSSSDITFLNNPTGLRAYRNIVISGGGVKTVSVATTVSGNLTLSGTANLASGYSIAVSGTTTLSGSSTLTLGANNILSSTPLVLDGGSFTTGASTGFSETVGTLNLSANSTISLGTGSHSLNFSNSSGVTWNGTSLTIDGWVGTPGSSGTSGKIFFGTTTGTLSAVQLGKINFTGYSGIPLILTTGELVPSASASSTATDYFRSKTTGNWSATSTWESSPDGISWINATLAPTNTANTITIRTGHTVSVNSSLSIDQTVIDNGGTLGINNGQTLTLSDGSGPDLTVNGSLTVSGTLIGSGTVTTSGTVTFNSGSTYEHDQNGGTIPNASWNAASTCLVTGITTTGPAGLNQTFGNLTWNCTSQTGNTAPAGDITVQGNFTLEAGTFELNNATGYTLTIAGNYNQTGGIFDFNSGANTGQGIVYIAGNFTSIAATLASITTNGSNAPNGKIVFNGSGVQTLNIPTSGSSQWVKYIVNIGSTVQLSSNLTLSSADIVSQLPYVGEFTVNGTIDFGDYTISKAGGIAGSGVFNLNSGANLITSNTLGISGSISSTNISSVFSSGANYEFQGATTGTFVTTPNANTVNNLIVNRSAGVTLSQNIAVAGNLIFTSGNLISTTSNLLSISNTSTSAISGASSSSFINGPVKWILPASLGSGSTYIFPTGKSSAYLPFSLVNPIAGTGTVTAQVEAFDVNAGGSFDATLESISTTEYWSLATTGNFTNSFISLDRGISNDPLDVIGGSVSAAGAYTSLEGTPGATGVSGSDPIGTYRYFVLAEKKKNTITTGTISGSPFCQGATVSVPFTISGTYNSGNIFTAQLSDASGSFSSPVSIGSLTSTGTGTISATIPSGASGGTGYRIRVVSSNPLVTGSDNGSNIAINVIPSAPMVGTIVQPTCDVATGSVTLNGLPSGNWTVTMNPGGVKTTGTGSGATISSLAPGTYSFTVTGEDESTACPGSGNGLKGEYFNLMDLSGTPVLTRTDATVNFNWGTGTPGSPVNVNVFSVRWSGKVQACYTENYTFTTRSDDGIRLWVNGSQIINNWGDHSATNNSGNISLVAGQKYDIVLEFYENGGDAVSQLSWSSASQALQIIPQSQLYSEATGCSSASSANVVINPQPVIPSAPTSVTPSSATSVCAGGSINLKATSAGNTIYWYTQASGGTSLGTSASGANFSVSPVANITYYAEAQSPEGCVSTSRTATGSISITPNLSAVSLSSTTQQDICLEAAGEQLSVTETGGGTIAERQWGKRSTSGGTITAISGATSSTYIPSGSDLGVGSWFLVCTSTPTCGSAIISNEVNVVVSESIGGTLSGGTSPSCIGSTTGTLTLTGYAGSIVRWERKINSGSWESLGNTGNNTFSDVAFFDTGTIKYRVAVKNGTCAEAYSTEVSINVDAASVGGWISYVDPICEGSSVTLVLNGSVGSVVRWEKHLGAGAWSSVSGTSTTLTDTPSSGGSWEYRAVVKSGSCSEVNSTPITVTVNPTLTITLGTDPEVCQTMVSTTILYTSTTGSPTGWVLTFNAAAQSAGFSSPQNGSIGSTSGNIPVNVPYSVGVGVYHANLKVIRYTPACSSIDYPVIITVSASQPASVNIAASSNLVCSGTSVTYTATPTNGGSTPTYQWKVNGTNAGTNSASYSYVPLNNDIVTCVLTSNASCATGSPATSNTVTMTVNPSTGVPVFTTGATSVCQNDPDGTYTATAANSTELTYSVLPVAAGSINASTGVMNWSASFSGTATITATATGLCGTTSSDRIVTVNPLPPTGEIVGD